MSCLKEYDEHMNSQLTRILTGLIIIMVGAGFLLDTLHVIDFGSIAGTWWPLLLVLAGVVMYLNDTKNYFWALLVAGFGVVFLLRELAVFDINPWQLFWPTIIIAVGLSVLFERTPRSRVSKSERDDVTAILGGTDQKNTSDDFRGSKITTIMAGAKLDLRKAIIKKEATVEVFAVMGGIEIVVPRNVTVRNQTSAILGGVEDTTEREGGNDAPVLHVVGDVIMAGVEIKN